MQGQLSAEQEDFRTALRGWLHRYCPAGDLRGWLDTADPTPFEERFAAAGWAGVGAPEELGGQGGGLVELAVAAEELGRAAAPSGSWLGCILAVPALAAAPDAATAMLAGGAATVLGLAADAIPGAQEPVRTAGAQEPVRTAGAQGPVRAEADRLHGVIRLVPGAGRARRVLVPARSGGGVVLHLVDVDQPAVRVTRRSLLDRTREVADVALDGAEGQRLDVDAAEVVREAAFRVAVLVAADALGCAERMLDLAVTYSGQRHQFGVPIGSFQAVKHAAATMLVDVEAARSIVYHAAAAVGPDAHLAAAVAKAQVTASAARVADSALTLHGAIGYTWEHDLQLFYKRAKLDARLFGAPAAWNELIAGELQLASPVN